MGKLMGIDYGGKKTGIALSDDSGAVAFPKEIVKNNKELINYIADLALKENISRIVIGQSVNYQGRDNPIMERIHQFKKALEKKISVPIDFEGEFLTSVEAQRQPQKANLPRSRKPKVHKYVDASAAALILQTFLDKRSHGT